MCKSKNNIIIIGISVLFLVGYLVWDHNGVLQKKMIESTSIKTEEEILGLIQKKEKKEEIPDVYFNDSLCAYDVESNTVSPVSKSRMIYCHMPLLRSCT